ncbi:MAG TPA: thioredoxin domain-containing protein [Pyrinomonadaceae bacterium]
MLGKAHFYKAFLVLIFTFSFGVFAFAQETKKGASPARQKGNPDAKVRIEVFNDYQCPTCASFDETLNDISRKYPNEVLIIYRNFPLTSVHKNAMAAAKAVEAAGKQGKFWEMMQLVYKNQERWSDSKSAVADFVKYAKKLGLNIETFKTDLESQTVADRINADIQRVEFLKLGSTPSVIFNGRILEFSEASDLEKIIEKELSK